MSEECEPFWVTLPQTEGEAEKADTPVVSAEHDKALHALLAAEREKVERLKRELERQLSRGAAGLAFDPWSARRALEEAEP